MILLYAVKYNNEESIIIKRENMVKESLTSTITEVVKEQIGNHKYYPLLLSLFLFIFISNILGMVPYSFTPTSHLIVTIGFSLPIMIGVTIIGFQNYNKQFFAIFLPVNTPN
jgi:F-type H+-transporting ATPase subunit a